MGVTLQVDYLDAAHNFLQKNAVWPKNCSWAGTSFFGHELQACETISKTLSLGVPTQLLIGELELRIYSPISFGFLGLNCWTPCGTNSRYSKVSIGTPSAPTEGALI